MVPVESTRQSKRLEDCTSQEENDLRGAEEQEA